MVHSFDDLIARLKETSGNLEMWYAILVDEHQQIHHISPATNKDTALRDGVEKLMELNRRMGVSDKTPPVKEDGSIMVPKWHPHDIAIMIGGSRAVHIVPSLISFEPQMPLESISVEE
jgi:hypothetical protein